MYVSIQQLINLIYAFNRMYIYTYMYICISIYVLISPNLILSHGNSSTVIPSSLIFQSHRISSNLV